MKCVRVDKDKNVFTITLETNKITPLLLHNKLNNRRNKKDFKLLHTYEFLDESVEVYGYLNGNEKNINKLELPQPLDVSLYFDDLVFCTKNISGYLNFQKLEFNNLFESLHDNFYNLDDSDGEFEQDEDYDYDDGFIVKDE